MKVDFASIPEYVLFKDLTTLDKMIGFVTIEPDYEPQNFKKEERLHVFRAMLDYYRDNGFEELMQEYIRVCSAKSYSNFRSIDEYNNFTFNHPMIVMLTMFIEQGLLTNDLKINSHVRKEYLGKEIYDRKKARELKIDEGIIFADGTLLKIESKEAHKLGSLWMFLNGRNLKKAIRYTDDCLNPEPIFTTLNEYANIGTDGILLTREQAVAIFNIHLAKSRAHVSFEHIVRGSKDLCISIEGNPEIRYENAKTLENALGKDVFNRREILEQLRYEKTIYRDV